MKHIFTLVRRNSFLFSLLCLFTATNLLHAQWGYTGLSTYSIPAIAVSGTDLYVGTEGHGVFYSASNGVGWNPVGTGLTAGYVEALAVSGTNVFAGTNDGGVFLTADSGAHWTAVNNGLTDLQVRALIVSGANLFAGTNDSIFLSTNNGANWTLVNNDYDNIYTICNFAVLGSNIFVGSLGGGIFRSTNNGTNWTSASSGLTPGGNGMAVLAFAVSGTNIFAATWEGVFLSANDGASWSSVSTGLTTLHVNVLAVSGANLYAGTQGAGVFLSTNNGASWTAVNAGLPASTSISALACLGTSIFASGVYGGGIYVANQTTLPVELTSFTASSKQNSIELKWKTATEINNYGFDVERKTIDNEQLTMNNWSKIGFAEGSGTTNAPKEYSFTEKNISTGKYFYRLKQIDRDGKFTYSQSVEVEVGVAPKAFGLSQNYPNPFNPSTTIEYSLVASGLVSVRVYDVLGREVASLVDERQEAGRYSVRLDASKLSSGFYYYTLSAGASVSTRKMLLLK
jgi:hypothetical protein